MAEMMRMEGREELFANLDVFAQNVQDSAMKQGVMAGAEVFKAAVQQRAPVKLKAYGGGKIPRGALKADLKTRAKRGEKGWMGIVEFGALTWYIARFVEWGHYLVRGGYLSVKRGKLRGKGKRVGRVDPHPFIRPAFDESTRAAMAAFVEAFRSRLKKRR